LLQPASRASLACNCRYLRDVDQFNDLRVSSFVTAGHVRFMLLHDQVLRSPRVRPPARRPVPMAALPQRTDEGAIKQFFADLHELYLKVHTSSFTRFRRLAG
jgi:hypothetical protein